MWRVNRANFGLAGVFALLCGILIGGCSGGSSSPPSVSTVERSYGPLVTRAAGTVQAPVVAAGSGAVITGVAGGTFDSITELGIPSRILNNTLILFRFDADGPSYTYTVNPDGKNKALVFSTSYPVRGYGYAWSPDGRKLAFGRTDGTNYHLFVYDRGTAQTTQLTSTPNVNEVLPAWSPDGTKIAYSRTSGAINSEIHVIKTDGTGDTRLWTNGDLPHTGASWSPDGKKIAFYTVDAFSKDGGIAVINADGTGYVNFTNPGEDNRSPRWSPDGKKILYMNRPSGSSFNTFYDLVTMDPNGGGVVRLTNTHDCIASPSWSPDGAKIAYAGYQGSGAGNGGTTYLAILSADGNLRTAFPDLFSNEVAWSPFLPQTIRKLVGTGGLIASSCGGFLYGQKGKEVTSIVTVDGQVRNDLRVSPLTGIEPGTPNIVYSITDNASLITTLRYMNYSTGRVVQAIGGGLSVTSAAGALVMFDAADGEIVNILPYSANRSTKPQVQDGSGERILSGSFLAVYDRDGHNLAPHGAHAVHIDIASGRVLGIH